MTRRKTAQKRISLSSKIALIQVRRIRFWMLLRTHKIRNRCRYKTSPNNSDQQQWVSQLIRIRRLLARNPTSTKTSIRRRWETCARKICFGRPSCSSSFQPSLWRCLEVFSPSCKPWCPSTKATPASVSSSRRMKKINATFHSCLTRILRAHGMCSSESTLPHSSH